MIKVKRMDVVKKGDQWRAESKGRAVPGTGAPRKTDAVKKTAQKARANAEAVTVADLIWTAPASTAPCNTTIVMITSVMAL